MTNRIQKLLFSEYCDLEELVLIESTFAETDRSGLGSRQVQLGLTPTKLIIAADHIRPANEAQVEYCFGLDPEIESFELISVIPVDCVNLSVFNRRKRHTLKAHYCNDVVKYYELGGFEHHQMFWNLWCEKVKFLSPNDDRSCPSETSAASSTTGSTLYVKSTTFTVNKCGKPQLWFHYGKGDANGEVIPDAEDRIVDPSLIEAELFPPNRSILQGKSLTEIRTIFHDPHKDARYFNCDSAVSLEDQQFVEMKRPINRQVNRFGSGVAENCNVGLYLTADSEDLDYHWISTVKREHGSEHKIFNNEMMQLSEDALYLWEKEKTSRPRHMRRYAFLPEPFLLYGITSLDLAGSELYSVKVKRTMSAVSLTKTAVEPEFLLPLMRYQIASSVSLMAFPRIVDSYVNRGRIFFWTPGYWYRPTPFQKIYKDLQKHLQGIHKFLNMTYNERRIRRHKHKRMKKKEQYDNHHREEGIIYAAAGGDFVEIINPDQKGMDIHHYGKISC